MPPGPPRKSAPLALVVPPPPPPKKKSCTARNTTRPAIPQPWHLCQYDGTSDRAATKRTTSDTEYPLGGPHHLCHCWRSGKVPQNKRDSDCKIVTLYKNKGDCSDDISPLSIVIKVLYVCFLLVCRSLPTAPIQSPIPVQVQDREVHCCHDLLFQLNWTSEKTFCHLE